MHIGLIFVVGMSYVSTEVFRKIWLAYVVRKARRNIVKRLHELTEDEKAILRYYVLNQTKTNVLRYHDGVVQGLATAGIIYLASSTGSLIQGIAYNISQVAWDCLNKDKRLLDGASGYARTDQVEYF
jgi:hypothetical protein